MSQTFGLPYDIYSILQKHSYSNSKNKNRTIIVNSDPDLLLIKTAFKKDIKAVRLFYNCDKV